MKKTVLILSALLWCTLMLHAQKPKTYQVQSPDGSIAVTIEAGAKLQWQVKYKGQEVIAPSPISMTLQGGEVLGDHAKATAKTVPVNTKFNTIHYSQAVVEDNCNQLTLTCKGNYGVIFRVYDNAVAYRFFTKRPGELIIENEEASFNFTADHRAFIPIQWDYRGGKIFNTSFENTYREIRLSAFPKDSLAFLPLVVDLGQNLKAELFEVDLEDYPGMYVDLNQTGKGFKGVYAPYPLETEVGGHNRLNIIPVKRAGYIAKTAGTRNFPWRAIVISEKDIDLLNSHIVQKLASPSRLADISWIKPGQVAWDWWNSMNISHVDFRSGMNTPSYKYYIDFAAKYKIPYILFDEGWNVPGDLTRVKPEIDLEEIVAYGKQRNVGLIVWCSWKDIMSQKEKAFPFFEKAGIKGMKIDFIDRDDQVAVASTYEIARQAAEHHLMVDYHGIYKPTGLQRTYPNVVGYEGVYGLENFKWANPDGPRYAVTIPFIRNQAGPMDYTSGAMRNASRASFRPINDMPMSQGTRVHQMAQYVVFEVPVQMLSDNPTAYLREHECTSFITGIPTLFDETLPLDGKIAEYVAIARRKGDTWFVGAMTNWTPREIVLDFSFLGAGEYTAEIFRDGINADRDGTDYKKEEMTIKAGEKVKISMMSGGGWVARLVKK